MKRPAGQITHREDGGWHGGVIHHLLPAGLCCCQENSAKHRRRLYSLRFARMVLIVALNASGLCSPEIKEAGRNVFLTSSPNNCCGALMVGVGVLLCTRLQIHRCPDVRQFDRYRAAIIVVGAVVGAAVGGW